MAARPSMAQFTMQTSGRLGTTACPYGHARAAGASKYPAHPDHTVQSRPPVAVPSGAKRAWAAATGMVRGDCSEGWAQSSCSLPVCIAGRGCSLEKDKQRYNSLPPASGSLADQVSSQHLSRLPSPSPHADPNTLLPRQGWQQLQGCPGPGCPVLSLPSAGHAAKDRPHSSCCQLAAPHPKALPGLAIPHPKP